MRQDSYRSSTFEGALTLIEHSIAERIKQFEKFIIKVSGSVKQLEEKNTSPERLRQQQAIIDAWPEARAYLGLNFDEMIPRDLLAEFKANSLNYIDGIKELSAMIRDESSHDLVRQVEKRILEIKELLNG